MQDFVDSHVKLSWANLDFISSNCGQVGIKFGYLIFSIILLYGSKYYYATLSFGIALEMAKDVA